MTRILVIESEVRARHALRNILISAGYEVEIADGDLPADHAADLVIADGAGGRLPGHGRVLAVPSGATGRDMAARAQNCLPKPFRRDDLLAAVRATLSMAPPRI